MKKCLIIGSTVCDIVIDVPRLPKTQEDIHPTNQTVQVGGCGYNVAHVVHHLNIPYTFLSPVGTGIYGEFVKQEMQKSGVLSNVRREEENGCCYCFVEENGERTFLCHHGAEYLFDPELFQTLDLTSYSYVYVCGLEVEDKDGEALVNALADITGTIVFCPSPRGEYIPKERLEKLFSYHPILHLNDLEALSLAKVDTCEKAAEVLYKKTNNLVLITMGSKGVLYYDGHVMELITSLPASVKNTIGAGDSHVGGVISALASGATIKQALQFANHVAGKVVSVASATLDNAAYDELKKLLPVSTDKQNV